MSLIRSGLRLFLAVGVIGSCLSVRAVPVEADDDAGVETAKTLYEQMGGGQSGEVAATAPATPLTAMPDPLAVGGAGASPNGLRTQDLILAGIEGKTVPAGTAATRALATDVADQESNRASGKGGWVLFGMIVVGFVLAGLALAFSGRQQQSAGSAGRRG